MGAEGSRSATARERGETMRHCKSRWIAVWALLAWEPTAARADDAAPRPGEMAGYLLVPHDKAPASFNAGFSLYVAAWPLLDRYPGNRFQTGLFGTWMHAQFDGKAPEKQA